MRTTLLAVLTVLLLAACNNENTAATSGSQPTGESNTGLQIGSTFDGKVLTLGEGELEGKKVVITYFATW